MPVITSPEAWEETFRPWLDSPSDGTADGQSHGR
jgi:hypothetical protein